MMYVNQTYSRNHFVVYAKSNHHIVHLKLIQYLMLLEKSLSHLWLFATPWTVAYQALPYMGFSRQEYWRGLPFPSPGDLPDPGIKPRSPALQADTLPCEPPEFHYISLKKKIVDQSLYLDFNSVQLFTKWINDLAIRKENEYLIIR